MFRFAEAVHGLLKENLGRELFLSFLGFIFSLFYLFCLFFSLVNAFNSRIVLLIFIFYHSNLIRCGQGRAGTVYSRRYARMQRQTRISCTRFTCMDIYQMDLNIRRFLFILFIGTERNFSLLNTLA